MQFVVIALLLVCVAMMVTLQLAKARPHRRRSAAERGRRRSFCLARNDPQGQGKKIGDNLCGRDDSCDQHVMQLRHREKRGGREGMWVNRRGRCQGRRLFCSSAPRDAPDEFELCRALPYAPGRLASVAPRCVSSGRAASRRPSKPRYPARLTRISNGNRCRAQMPCNLRIAPITGLLPAAASAIRR